jgi:hypothetical protein
MDDERYEDIEREVHDLEAECVGDIIRGATNLVRFWSTAREATVRRGDEGPRIKVYPG